MSAMQKLSVVGLLGLALSGCGSDETMVSMSSAGTGGSGSPVGAAGEAAGGTGGSGTLDPPPCVENPVTHLEIINACTDSVGVRKTPQLTLLNPDGTLPPP